METLIPERLTASVARTASAISVPATKRPDTRRPTDERSAKLRTDRFSDNRTKNPLSMDSPPWAVRQKNGDGVQRRMTKIRIKTHAFAHRNLYHKRRSPLREWRTRLSLPDQFRWVGH